MEEFDAYDEAERRANIENGLHEEEIAYLEECGVEEVPEMVYKIIWFAKDGSVLGETRVADAEDLDEYIQETTEGLDVPEGWDQYKVEEVA
jgi:hypothetical protein